MKKMRIFFLLPLLAGILLLTSFSSPSYQRHHQATKPAFIQNYAWYTPDGQFVAWSTLANALVVSGDDLNPANGTLDLEGWTQGNFGVPPSGTLVYKLYRHP